MTDSLKEQALALLATIENSEDACCSWDFTTIREALESISDDGYPKELGDFVIT